MCLYVGASPFVLAHRATAKFEWTPGLAMTNGAELLSSVDTLINQRHLVEARAACQEYLEQNAPNVRVLLALCRIEKSCGDGGAACGHARAAANLEPTNPRVLGELAQALRELDRHNEAKEVYERILGLDERHAPSHLGLGWLAFLRRDEEAAVRHFTAAFESLRAAADADPKKLHVQVQLAYALRGLKQHDEAAATFEKILTVDARHIQAHVGLGHIALMYADHVTALAHFKAAADLNPIDLSIHVNVANCLALMTRVGEAKAIFTQLSAQGPRHFRDRVALGDLARTLLDWVGALQHFQAALESEPGNIGVRIKIGGTLCDMDQWELAEESFRSILIDSPQNVDALIGLAHTARAKGDRSAALGLLQTAAALAPFDIWTKKEIRRLQAADGSIDWKTEIDDAAAVARSPRASLGDRIHAADTLIAYGLTELAAPILSELQDRSPHARKLLRVLREIERMGLAQPQIAGAPSVDGIDHQLESLRGYVERPFPGSDTLLLVFGQMEHRLWVTFSLLHKMLRSTGASVIYVRDLQQNCYTGGIVGLGDDIDSTANGFRALATRHGARRILTLGYCVGCIGALRYGLLLGADGVLGLHPRVQSEDARLLTEKAGIRGARIATQADPHTSILAEYRDAAARPQVTFIFGEDCASDVAAARSLAEVAEVAAIAIPGSSDLNTLSELLSLGVLEPVLSDFVAGAAIAPATRAKITANANQRHDRREIRKVTGQSPSSSEHRA
jgi:tetratricopeptide (TPR) repeat protein